MPDCHGSFELIDHTADLAIKVHAATREELLSSSVRALYCLLEIEPRKEDVFLRELSITGNRFDELIVNLLNKILLILETESFIVAKAQEVKIHKYSLDLKLYGYPVNEEDIHGEVIKAVTYHDLSYSENPYSIKITMDL